MNYQNKSLDILNNLVVTGDEVVGVVHGGGVHGVPVDGAAGGARRVIEDELHHVAVRVVLVPGHGQAGVSVEAR